MIPLGTKDAQYPADVVIGGDSMLLLDGQLQGKPHTREATVHFATVTEEDIAAYAATGGPLGCAGAFTLEAIGGWFIDRIEGDPSSVIGLSQARDSPRCLQFWPQRILVVEPHGRWFRRGQRLNRDYLETKRRHETRAREMHSRTRVIPHAVLCADTAMSAAALVSRLIAHGGCLTVRLAR